MTLHLTTVRTAAKPSRWQLYVLSLPPIDDQFRDIAPMSDGVPAGASTFVAQPSSVVHAPNKTLHANRRIAFRSNFDFNSHVLFPLHHHGRAGSVSFSFGVFSFPSESRYFQNSPSNSISCSSAQPLLRHQVIHSTHRASPAWLAFARPRLIRRSTGDCVSFVFIQHLQKWQAHPSVVIASHLR